jgi:Transposase DDE domain
VELSETVYALDSTTIDLCLSLFPWGKFRRRKSAVKLHTLLDLRGSIPTNVYVTGGQVHDVNILDEDELLPEAGAVYLLDRGYVDFGRLYVFTQACAFFITRAKKNMRFYRRSSRPVERSAGLRCDQTILLTGVRTAQRCPDPLRRIHYFDAEKDSRLTFLTNHFLLPAWVALSVYVLVAIVKKQPGLDLSLYKILQILSVTVFEKTPILEGFSNFSDEFPDVESCMQLRLFDF